MTNNEIKEKNLKLEKPIAVIDIAEFGKIEIELYPDVAYNTVCNFISLAKSGYYNGLIFHRVIKDFMIQGGDPTGTGTGGPGYTIKGEFSSNGFKNDVSHEPGVISMARTPMPDSAGSQFFICAADCKFLDGQYAAFGKVTSGLDVVYKIAEVPTDFGDRPYNDVIMNVVIDEKGGDYSYVEKSVH